MLAALLAAERQRGRPKNEGASEARALQSPC
jgi:hypothetical protein